MTRLRLVLVLVLAGALEAQRSGELRFCLRGDPKTLHPLHVDDDASEAIRYLTGGVLIRVNRATQALQPELATAWKVDLGGRRISFQLRQGAAFSDGTPFLAEDVAYTMRSLMDPALHSPTGDSFRSGSGQPQIAVTGKDRISITFPAPVADLERLFDQVAIMSSRSPKKEMAVLGPFFVASYQAGAEILLRRNPYYWKRDSAGRQLPYLDAVRLTIQQNREIELVRFRRGQLDLINSLDAELYHQMAPEMGSALRDLGPSLESEMLWFNQVARAPLPEYKKAWFRSTAFRRAVSEAINREDLCRVVFRGHARPAEGPVSPANRFWFNSKLRPHPYDVKGALRRLAEAGFRLENGTLRDGGGHAVEFSVVTNAGNKTRERMALLIQQDLRAVGIKLNVVTLDFPSLIERLSRTYQYEACLLGLTNLDLDPNGQMNVWLSSAANHQWNPSQKTPETAWEAEIDRLMRKQAAAIDRSERKRYFDRVQEIVSEQAPFLYLVNKNALAAYSPSLGNVAATPLRPQVYWNIEQLTRMTQIAGTR